jgi:hypothetical protein
MAMQDSDAPSADLVLESGGVKGSAWSVECVGWPRTATVSSRVAGTSAGARGRLGDRRRDAAAAPPLVHPR